MASKLLKDADVRNAGPGYHADGDRLYLQVTDGGAKSWLLRYKLNGKRREMGLGGYPTFSLTEARVRAGAAAKLLADGIDPLAHKAAVIAERAAAEDKRKKFAWCAEQYIAAKKAGWKNAKHADQWTNTLTNHAGKIADKFVDEITNEDVLEVLEPIWGTLWVTATRVRERIERVLSWATVKRYRTGPNPAVWRGNMQELLADSARVKKKKNHPSLHYRYLPAFMEALRAQPGRSARLLEFTILTVARTTEARKATRPEVVGDTWTIPAERMKAGEEHYVPLCQRALELIKPSREKTGSHLERAPHESELLFPNPGGKGYSENGMLAVLKRMKRQGTLKKEWGHFSVHGFRSTFSTWARDKTQVQKMVSEKALAHKLKDEAEAAYASGAEMIEKRTALLAKWARYCAAPKLADVHPIRKAA